MKKMFAALVLGISASGAAFADNSDLYIALDVGQTKAADVCTGTPPGWSCTDTSTAIRFAGGTKITPMWGAEVSYADLGKATVSGTFLGATLTDEFKATALQISGTGTFAVNDAFSVIAKLSLVNSSVTLTSTLAGFSASTTAQKTNLGFGIGGLFNVNKNVGIRFQYEDLGTFGDAVTTGTSKIQLMSAGLVYKFN